MFYVVFAERIAGPHRHLSSTGIPLDFDSSIQAIPGGSCTSIFWLLGFEPPQVPVALNIEYTILDALSVWRRTNAFILPDSIWFFVTRAITDRDLNVLSIFFESLKGYETFPQVHLQLITAPRQPTYPFVCLLNCIRVSGCKDLHCYDVQ